MWVTCHAEMKQLASTYQQKVQRLTLQALGLSHAAASAADASPRRAMQHRPAPHGLAVPRRLQQPLGALQHPAVCHRFLCVGLHAPKCFIVAER